MLLLAFLSPAAHGIESDDGFVIGQLTLSGTLNLLVVGCALGAFGGAVYCAVRPLVFGGRAFQIASISIGAAVVVGSMLVRPTGVDFYVLRPTWLAVALFTAIPGVYAGLLTVVAERWLRPGSWFDRRPDALVVAPAVVLVVFPPLAAVFVGGWLAAGGARRTAAGTAVLDAPATRWAARGALAAAWLFALVTLVRDAAVLT